jgi:hypothetical protein
MQSAYGGGNYDGFLVKFNSAGVRQWGTYYGSIGDDTPWSCDVESNGNIYMSGFTSGSSSGNYFATAGAYQSSYGGGPSDAFLAKFNSSGVRIWGTYYGGNGNDQSYSCASDNKGSVYLAGFTDSASVALTTPGAHQVTFGGIEDGLLIRFDSAGTRIWGTFYGGAGTDWGTSCITDTTGNVFLIGYSSGATSTAIATPGSQQNIYGGGAYDGYCAKFNSSGIRQWGTFYGGSGDDNLYGCATDAAGNIYICGTTTSPSSTLMVSAGAYQSIYGGGSDDAFFAKLDASGMRQWGSFYGGNTIDGSFDCTVDFQNNLYLAGYSSSTNTVSISTPGAYQPGYNGSSDAFLVKFDGCGVLPAPGSINGTANFCGTPTSPQTYTIAPVSGALSYAWNFPSGWSGSSTTNSIMINNITSTGYLTVAATNSCGVGPVSSVIVTINSSPVISVPSGTICSGKNFTLVPSGASTYTFSSGSAIVSPTVTTTYSVTGTSTAGCVSSSPVTSTVTVKPTPTITVNSGSFCAGGSFTMVPSGANTYTFQGGSAVVSPTASTSYTVAGTSTAGCVSASPATSSVTVLPNPTVTVGSSQTITCAVPTATINASGALSYTWNGTGIVSGSNSAVATVTQANTYSVIGSSAGCTSNIGLVTVTSNTTSPLVTANTSNSIICRPPFQGTATLTATGASSYTWNPGGIGTSISISPSVTTQYTVTGTNSVNGCTNTTVFTQSVSTCTGISKQNLYSENTIFPNPTSGSVIIKAKAGLQIQVYNIIGELIISTELKTDEIELDLSNQASGVYVIRIGSVTKKIIKE